MNHFEIILLIHPEHSGQVAQLQEHYLSLIKQSKGVVHRNEDWGVRQLAYPIKKQQQAHYLLMNIEVSLPTLKELENNFRYSESVMRSLIVRETKAVDELSCVLVQDQKKKQQAERYQRRNQNETPHQKRSFSSGSGSSREARKEAPEVATVENE